ncbi:hypothetical protein EDC96DRAFT_550275 [Choanephora cucurbitarum]|nr:hypothetical protein EDC96DRAFT_550275 [Choanephora cucurbitarum]
MHYAYIEIVIFGWQALFFSEILCLNRIFIVFIMLESGYHCTKATKRICLNCNSTDHLIKDCQPPCKLCKENIHRHYECKLYKSNASQRNMTQSESMLIEELYLFETRQASEMEEDSTNIRKILSANMTIFNYASVYPKKATKRVSLQKSPCHPTSPMNDFSTLKQQVKD